MPPSTHYAVLLALVIGVGCGDPNEKANELYVEAVKLISSAEEKTGESAIKDYEKALANLRKIVDDYSKSDLAVKLVSNETLFTGKSLKDIESRVKELRERSVGVDKSSQTNPTIKPQHSYYLFAELIELAVINPEGKEWDIDDSGPDITYAIHLNGREIFRAPRKGKDNTVCEWNGLSQDFSLLNGSASVDGIIKASLISVNAGDTLTVKVWDNDIASNDEAGEFALKTTELKLGESEWWRYGDTWSEGRDAKRPDASRGLKRLRLRVIDSDKKAEFIASQLNLPLEKVKDMLNDLTP